MNQRTDKKKIKITLDPNAVINPLLKVLKECSNSILFGLQVAEIVKDIPPDLVLPPQTHGRKSVDGVGS